MPSRRESGATKEDGTAPNPDPPADATRDVHLRSTFHRSVDEGVERLNRSWPDLIATGVLGGIDVSFGVLAMLVTLHVSGSTVVAALAFPVGFLALTLGRSELFTENFLVPVAAIAAKKASIPSLLRLWGVALLTNLAGGWLFAWLIVWGLPDTHASAAEIGRQFAEHDTGRLIALGLLAGAVITLMTWMAHGATESIGELLAIVAAAYVLAVAHLNHVVVVSIEMFVALHAGDADFGYGAWARVAAIATVSNLLGGLLLVTVFRLVQVGHAQIEEERRRPVDHDHGHGEDE